MRSKQGQQHKNRRQRLFCSYPTVWSKSCIWFNEFCPIIWLNISFGFVDFSPDWLLANSPLSIIMFEQKSRSIQMKNRGNCLVTGISLFQAFEIAHYLKFMVFIDIFYSNKSIMQVTQYKIISLFQSIFKSIQTVRLVSTSKAWKSTWN